MKQFGAAVASIILVLTSATLAQSNGSGSAFGFASQPIQPVSAQSIRRGPAQGQRHILELVADKLDFSPAQQQALETLIGRQEQSVAKLHQDTSLTDDQKSERFQEIQQQTKEQFAAMLTAEQKREFEKMMR